MEETTIAIARETSVGFVGLGMLGMPMAQTLLERGRRMVVFDPARDKVDTLVDRGAEGSGRPADVASRAGILICAAETTEQAEAVIFGADGFVQTACAGDLVILLSTIDWVIVKKMHAALAEKGIAFVDAPVAGMRNNSVAKSPSLKCFAGGDPLDLDRARPILEIMTSQIVHWGPAGHGTVFKLLNSMVQQANRIVAAEALALGAKAGLDIEQMLLNFASGYANSVALQNIGPRLLARNFDGIPMSVTIRDVELQTALGKALEMPMLMATQGQQVYHMARAMGFGEEDGSAVIKVYESWTGRQVRGQKQP